MKVWRTEKYFSSSDPLVSRQGMLRQEGTAVRLDIWEFGGTYRRYDFSDTREAYHAVHAWVEKGQVPVQEEVTA